MDIQAEHEKLSLVRTDLDKADRSREIGLIRKAIDFGDYVGLTTFGEKAQKAVTDFSSRILARVSASDGTDPELILRSILQKAEGLDVDAVSSPGALKKLFSSSKSRIAAFRTKFVDVAAQIDGLAVRIEKHRVGLQGDISTLEELYVETMSSIRNLDDHIVAAVGAIEEMRVQTLPQLRQEAADSADQLLAGQRVMDAEQAADRLEKRVLQLRQARQIAFQQLPQIRIVQAGDETLIQNLGAALDLTIPAWKQKMVLVLGISNQRHALAMDKAVASATGRLLKESARMVSSQSIEIEMRSQEGLLSTDVLKETNDILIKGIHDIVQKQAAGRDARKESERKISAMATELEAALVGRT